MSGGQSGDAALVEGRQTLDDECDLCRPTHDERSSVRP